MAWLPTRPGLVILLAAVVLAVFAALRGPEIASDFITYQSWYYQRQTDASFIARPGILEALYFFLSDLFAAAGLSFRYFVFAMAAVATYLKMRVMLRFSRTAMAYCVALLSYLLWFYLLHDFTQIRAGIAVAIVFLAFQELMQGGRIRFALLVLAAAGFHSSALLFLALLLPYGGPAGRVIHFSLIALSVLFIVLSAFGISAGIALATRLESFDPRLQFYIAGAMAEDSAIANPFPVMGVITFLLVMSLSRICWAAIDGKDEHEPDAYALLLISRSVLIGVCFLETMWMVQAIALRLYEITAALLPILVAIVFSRKGWMLQKMLALLWMLGAAYVAIFRADGLVRPYMVFFQ